MSYLFSELKIKTGRFTNSLFRQHHVSQPLNSSFANILFPNVLSRFANV